MPTCLQGNDTGNPFWSLQRDRWHEALEDYQRSHRREVCKVDDCSMDTKAWIQWRDLYPNQAASRVRSLKAGFWWNELEAKLHQKLQGWFSRLVHGGLLWFSQSKPHPSAMTPKQKLSSEMQIHITANPSKFPGHTGLGSLFEQRKKYLWIPGTNSNRRTFSAESLWTWRVARNKQ